MRYHEAFLIAVAIVLGFAIHGYLTRPNPGPAPGNAGDPSSQAAAVPDSVMRELRGRWNEAAAGVTAIGPVGVVDFRWDGDRFPHPTFKGGSAEAYGAFARVLVTFLSEPGTFEFLATNNLFTAPLRYGDMKVDWTLGKLIDLLAGPMAHGDHDGDTRNSLRTFRDKIAGR